MLFRSARRNLRRCCLSEGAGHVTLQFTRIVASFTADAAREQRGDEPAQYDAENRALFKSALQPEIF